MPHFELSASSLEDTLSGLKSPLSATGQKNSHRSQCLRRAGAESTPNKRFNIYYQPLYCSRRQIGTDQSQKKNCFQCRQFVRPDYTASLPASPMQYGLKRLGLAFCYMLIQVTSATENLFTCIVDKDETTNLTGDRIPLPPSELACQ